MSRRVTTAWGRAQQRRRRVYSVLAAVMIAGLAYTTPILTASAGAGWDRHVIAEARGDTAYHISREIAAHLRMDPLPAGQTLQVVRTSDSTCSVSWVGVAVDCAAKVRVKRTPGGAVRVIARRHGERHVVFV